MKICPKCGTKVERLGNKRQSICEEGHAWVVGRSGGMTLLTHSIRKGIQGKHGPNYRRPR